jgi:hypothetical protein
MLALIRNWISTRRQARYIGWDRGLSLAWGRHPVTRAVYVSLAWDRSILMLTWGTIPAAITGSPDA